MQATIKLIHSLLPSIEEIHEIPDYHVFLPSNLLACGQIKVRNVKVCENYSAPRIQIHVSVRRDANESK